MTTYLRVTQPSAHRAFLVDVEAGKVFAPHGEGEKAGFDLARPLSAAKSKQVLSAARDLAAGTESHPGSWSADGKFMQGSVVNAPEVARLQNGERIPLAHNQLESHLDFFDDGTGWIRWRNNYNRWRELDYSKPAAFIKATGSQLVFGRPQDRFGIDIERIGQKRPKNSTHIFDEAGLLNADVLDGYLAAFDAKGGTLSTKDVLELVKEKAHVGKVSRAQFGSFFELCEHLNGSKTVTRDQFKRFYEGSLLWDARDTFAARKTESAAP